MAQITGDKFWEEKRIIDPDDTEEARAFEAKALALAKMLYPHHDFTAEPVRFVMTDEEEINAFFLGMEPWKVQRVGHEHPIIGFSKGILEFFDNEDQFVGVHFHELGHFGLERDLGAGGNSVAEERLAADHITGLRGVFNAGYDPREMPKFWRKLTAASRGDIGSELASAADVHGRDSTRIEDLKAGLISLGPGVETRQPRPFADRDLYLKAQHRSYFDRWKESVGYDALSPEQQVEALTAEIPNMMYGPRIKEGVKLAEEAAAKLQLPEQLEAFMRFPEAVLQHSHDSNGKGTVSPTYIYGRFAKMHGGPLRQPRLLEPLNEAIDRFLQAQSREEAEKAAYDIEHLEISCSVALSVRDSCVPLKGFALPKAPEGIGQELPWNRFIQWAREDKRGRIATVLQSSFEVREDDRLWDRDISGIPRSSQYTGTRMSPLGLPDEHQARDYYFNDAGIILEIAPGAGLKRRADGRERIYAEQAARLQGLRRTRADLRSAEAHLAWEALQEPGELSAQELSDRIKLLEADRRGYMVARTPDKVLDDMALEAAVQQRSTLDPHTRLPRDMPHRWYDPMRMQADNITLPGTYQRGRQDSKPAPPPAPPSAPAPTIWQRILRRQPQPAPSQEAREKPLAAQRHRARYDGQRLVPLHHSLTDHWLDHYETRLAAGERLDEEEKALFVRHLNDVVGYRPVGSERDASPFHYFGENSGPSPLTTAQGVRIVNMALTHGRELLPDASQELEPLQYLLAHEGRNGGVYYKSLFYHLLHDNLKEDMQQMQRVGRKVMRGEWKDMDGYRPIILDKVRQAVGYTPPTTNDELAALEVRLNEVFPDITLTRPEDRDFTLTEHQALRASILGQETLAYLLNAREPDLELLPRLEALFPQEYNRKNDYLHTRNAAGYRTMLFQKVLERYLDKHDVWPDEPEALIAHYKGIESRGLFASDRRMQSRVLGRIMERVRGQDDPVRKRHLLEKLLAGDVIFDAEIRREAVALWAENRTEFYGLDDGSEQYAERIAPEIDAVLAREDINLGDRRAMLRQWGDGIVAQKAVAEHMNELPPVSRERLQQKDSRAMASDAALALLQESRDSCRATLEFFAGSDAVRESNRLYRQLLHLKAETNEYLTPGTRATLWKHVSPETLRHIHQQFHGESLEGKAYMVNRLLTTYSPSAEQQLKLVTDILIPADDPNRDKVMRTLTAYHGSLKDYEQSYFLAAVLATAGQGKKSEEIEAIGAGIASFCEMRGPAEYKFGQQLNSNPSVPASIRDETAGLKSRGGIPSRADTIALYEDRVPAAVRNEIAYPGKVIGTGSYYITVECRRQDGTQTVMSLLRKDAQIQAQSGFRSLQQTAEALAEPVAQRQGLQRLIPQAEDPLPTTLSRLVQQAQAKSHIEIDSIAGHQQVQVAQRLYDPVNIHVDGALVEFAVMPWLNYGDGYKEMHRAPGIAFNSLPTATTEQREVKHKVAKAVMAMELMNILRGGRFDEDRHGDQANIEVTGTDRYRVNIYDTGGMALEPPTAKERMVMSHLLYGCSEAARKNESVGEYLLGQAKHLERLHLWTPAVMSFQKALLATNDYREYYRPSAKDTGSVPEALTAQDWQQIFTAVQQTQQMDPLMQGVLAVRSVMGGKLPSRVQPGAELPMTFEFFPDLPQQAHPAVHVEKQPDEFTLRGRQGSHYVLPQRKGQAPASPSAPPSSSAPGIWTAHVRRDASLTQR